MSVKYALLALLYQRPMHGYELGKQLKLAVHAEWDVKPGQVASTLARLKDAELDGGSRNGARADRRQGPG